MSCQTGVPGLIRELRASSSLALEGAHGDDADLLRRAADALELRETGFVTDHPAVDVLAEQLGKAADLARVNRWPAIESYLAESARVFRRASDLRPALLQPRSMYRTTLASGGSIDVSTCGADEIRLEDIAAGLSNACRFGGQLRKGRFYSVAEHSVRVSELVPREMALWALLHDASEAYIGDVLGPHKCSPYFDGYRGLEARLRGVIFERFGLTGAIPAEVDAADRLMLQREMLDFGISPFVEGSAAARLAPVVCWSPGLAVAIFVERFRFLSQELASRQGKA